MIKHRGFPGRLPGTDFQFTIRRANPKGVTPITRRERKRDRKRVDLSEDGKGDARIRQTSDVFRAPRKRVVN